MTGRQGRVNRGRGNDRHRTAGSARAASPFSASLAGVLLVASVALNFANIIGRYFFSVSISWAEEIMLFLMVGCVFLGNGVVAWSGRQIRMDVVVGMMPAKVRDALDAVLRAGVDRDRRRRSSCSPGR